MTHCIWRSDAEYRRERDQRGSRYSRLVNLKYCQRTISLNAKQQSYLFLCPFPRAGQGRQPPHCCNLRYHLLVVTAMCVIGHAFSTCENLLFLRACIRLSARRADSCTLIGCCVARTSRKNEKGEKRYCFSPSASDCTWVGFAWSRKGDGDEPGITIRGPNSVALGQRRTFSIRSQEQPRI